MTLKFLIVEDITNTLESLVAALEDDFPEASFDVAKSVDAAMAAIDGRLAKSENYDVVILDLRLPKKKGLQTTDVDTSICERISDVMKDSLVVHISSYMDEPQVRRHILDWHVNRLDTMGTPDSEKPHGGFAIPKEGADWVGATCDRIRGYLVSRPIRQELQSLLAEPPRSRLRSNQVAVHRIELLCRRIEQSWKDLDPGLQNFVRRQLVVDESGECLRVRLPA